MKKTKSERQRLIDQCDKIWSQCIIKRDNTCRYTNSSEKLSAHHIRSRRHLATRWSLDNGLCLTWSVHSLQKFNPELFHDKIIEIIGQKEYDCIKALSSPTTKYSLDDLREIKRDLERKLNGGFFE